MRSKAASSGLAVLAAAWCVCGAQGETLKSFSPQLRADLQCMMRVLKKEPLVSDVHIRFITSRGWYHPYLAYRVLGDDIAFDTNRRIDGSGVHYSFVAYLNGLTSSLDERPSDMGTSVLVEKWERICRIDVRVELA